MAGGRPAKYKSDMCEQVRKLCLLGADDKAIADFFDVAVSTINNWKKDHPEFLESIKEGKDIADAQVAERLYKRAMGYSHADTKFATYEGKITDEQEYTKHYPPDTAAAIFWLKNRQKENWRDKQDHEHSGPDGGPIEYRNMSDAELAAKIKKLGGHE